MRRRVTVRVGRVLEIARSRAEESRDGTVLPAVGTTPPVTLWIGSLGLLRVLTICDECGEKREEAVAVHNSVEQLFGALFTGRG